MLANSTSPWMCYPSSSRWASNNSRRLAETVPIHRLRGPLHEKRGGKCQIGRAVRFGCGSREQSRHSAQTGRRRALPTASCVTLTFLPVRVTRATPPRSRAANGTSGRVTQVQPVQPNCRDCGHLRFSSLRNVGSLKVISPAMFCCCCEWSVARWRARVQASGILAATTGGDRITDCLDAAAHTWLA
jgi:hypothetical protein